MSIFDNTMSDNQENFAEPAAYHAAMFFMHTLEKYLSDPKAREGLEKIIAKYKTGEDSTTSTMPSYYEMLEDLVKLGMRLEDLLKLGREEVANLWNNRKGGN